MVYCSWLAKGAGVEYGKKLVRSYPGKAGWFAGVYATLFVSRFMGISYDAPTRTFRFAPLPATGDFAWSDFPMGAERFSVSCRYVDGATRMTFANANDRPVRLELLVPVTGGQTVQMNGKAVESAKKVSRLGYEALEVHVDVPARGTCEVQAVGRP